LHLDFLRECGHSPDFGSLAALEESSLSASELDSDCLDDSPLEGEAAATFKDGFLALPAREELLLFDSACFPAAAFLQPVLEESMITVTISELTFFLVVVAVSSSAAFSIVRFLAGREAGGGGGAAPRREDLALVSLLCGDSRSFSKVLTVFMGQRVAESCGLI